MDRNFAPNYYPAGTKVIYEDGTNYILRIRNYLLPGYYHLGKKVVGIEIPDNAVNQMAEQRRIAQAGAEMGRRAAEQAERMAREGREREERMDREREAGAEARLREDRRRIENARPYDNNNPAPPMDYGRQYDGVGHPLYWGGRKSRRGRKSNKSRKRRSMKRRSRKTIRRRR
jgi:hypothetical protein